MTELFRCNIHIIDSTVLSLIGRHAVQERQQKNVIDVHHNVSW